MSWDGCPQALQQGFSILPDLDQKTVSVAATIREDTASVTREHKFLSGDRGNLCVKEFK